MNKKGNIDFSEEQMNLLFFISEVIQIKEEEYFNITKVDLCSDFSLFSSKDDVTCHMLIIANDSYWDVGGSINYFMNNKVTDEQCISKLSGRGKALFLKYKYNSLDGNARFRKNRLITIDDTDYINAINFPYLNSAIEMLYRNSNGGQITSDVVDKTLQQIETKKIFEDVSISSRRNIENNIIDSLNGKSKSYKL